VTKIEWCDAVWNPVVGCSRVSAGCENCYAERVAHRGMSEQHRGLTVLGRKGPRWTGEVRFLAERLEEPLRWRKPRRVFVNSMSDLFHEGVSDAQIAAVFGVMAATPQHTYQILTKRPERARAFMSWIVAQDREPGECTPGLLHACAAALAVETQHHPLGDAGPLHTERCADPAGRWPLPNVWLGVSVEDQATADERIPVLLETPAAIRWVSYEPAIGPVDLSPWMPLWTCPGGHEPDVWNLDPAGGIVCGDCGAPKIDGAGLNWIVVGGESGPGARPFDLAWARWVIAQGREAGVAVFVKQLGARPVVDHPIEPGALLEAKTANRKGADPAEWPAGLCVRQWPEATS